MFLAVCLATASYVAFAYDPSKESNASEGEAREAEQSKLKLIEQQRYLIRQIELDADRKRLQMQLELIRVDDELAVDNTVDQDIEEVDLTPQLHINSRSINDSKKEEAKILALHPHWGRMIHTYEFNEWLLEQSSEVKRLSESKRGEDVIILLEKFKEERGFLE